MTREKCNRCNCDTHCDEDRCPNCENCETCDCFGCLAKVSGDE